MKFMSTRFETLGLTGTAARVFSVTSPYLSVYAPVTAKVGDPIVAATVKLLMTV